MSRRGIDKGFWALIVTIGIAMSSMSLLFCPTAKAHDSTPEATSLPSHTPTEASKTALTLQSDDDGDELLEHWSNPQFVKEERLQTVGIVVLLLCTGGASARRRRLLKGHCRD